MSQRITTNDDLTDREVTGSTHYTVVVSEGAPKTTGKTPAGDTYEIDLTAESHAALVAMLTGKTDEFHKYMRRYVTDSGPAARRPRGTSPRNPAPASDGNTDETKRAREFVKTGDFKAPAIKEWGRANGLSEFVKDGPGVLPGTLVVAFAKAHGMPETAPEPPADSPADSTETAPAESGK